MNFGEMREQWAAGMKPGKRGDNSSLSSFLSFLASTGNPHTSLSITVLGPYMHLINTR